MLTSAALVRAQAQLAAHECNVTDRFHKPSALMAHLHQKAVTMTCLGCNVRRLEYYHRSYGFGLTAGTSILEWSGSNLAAVSIQQGER